MDKCCNVQEVRKLLDERFPLPKERGLWAVADRGPDSGIQVKKKSGKSFHSITLRDRPGAKEGHNVEIEVYPDIPSPGGPNRLEYYGYNRVTLMGNLDSAITLVDGIDKVWAETKDPFCVLAYINPHFSYFGVADEAA